MNLPKSPAEDLQLQNSDTVPSCAEPSNLEVVVSKQTKQIQAKVDTGSEEMPERKLRQRRTEQKEGPGGFEEMFPRNKRSENIGGVSYVKSRTPDVVQGMPSARCSLEIEERYGNRVSKAIEEGRAVAALMGVNLEKKALEIMDEDEVRMYKYWDGGRRKPPEEDWEALKKEGTLKHGAVDRHWEDRAEDLRELYGVSPDSVNAVAAREWWKRNDGWRPLVTAIGKLKNWSQVHEREECVKAFEHFRCHREWVRASVVRYERKVGRAMRMLKKRLENVMKQKREWGTVTGMEGEDDERIEGAPNMQGAMLDIELDGSFEETGEPWGLGGENARDQMTTDANRNGINDAEHANPSKQ